MKEKTRLEVAVDKFLCVMIAVDNVISLSSFLVFTVLGLLVIRMNSSKSLRQLFSSVIL